MIIILLKPVQIVILVQLYQFVIVVLNKLNIVETILSRRHKIRGKLQRAHSSKAKIDVILLVRALRFAYR